MQSKLQAQAVVDSDHVYKKKKKKIKGAVTHVIASPIQMQSLKQDMELVMLQKERNVKYFQSRLKPVLSFTQQRMH